MDSIEIKGYKSIKDIKVEFRPINILIGANGSGKSNFLSFFEFLNRLYEQKLTEYVALSGGEEKMLHKGSKVTPGIYSKIKFGNDEYSFELQSGDSSLIFTSEKLAYYPKIGSPRIVDIAAAKREAGIKSHIISNEELMLNYSKPYPRPNNIRGYLNSLKKYHFHDTGKNSPFNTYSSCENDIYFLYEKGDNLAAFLYNIQRNHQLVYNRIIHTIQSIAPYFSDFYFQPNEAGFVRLLWQDKFSSTLYGANDLSDGTIRFIALTTLFLQPKLPTTIIIDEPELGLHPFAIAKLAGMIQSVATRNVQVIVATQSTELVNHFEPEDILTVDQRDGESTFKRLEKTSLSDWLEEYSIGDLWQRNIIATGQPN